MFNSGQSEGTRLIAEFRDNVNTLQRLKSLNRSLFSPQLQAKKAAALTDLVGERIKLKERAENTPGGIDYDSKAWKNFKADTSELIDRMRAADKLLRDMKGEASRKAIKNK